jgi:hypothetical protein
MAQDSGKSWAVVKTVMHVRGPLIRGELLAFQPVRCSIELEW